jgi:hypothetical protein
MIREEEITVLSSWKEIARYLGKSVRTVQRWEQQLGLPVRRPVGAAQKSAVLLHRGELDTWLAKAFATRAVEVASSEPVPPASDSRSNELRVKLRTARELAAKYETLTLQIAESIHLLRKRCEVLVTQSMLYSPRSAPDMEPESTGITGTSSQGAWPKYRTG